MNTYTSLLLASLLLLPLGLCAQAGAAADSISMSIDMDDVVVTAQYAPTDSRSALHRVRTIKQEAIAQRGAITLEQLLQQELNIRISQDLILGSSMSLQGVAGQNVKIMIDGVPVIGRVGDDIDLSQISLSQIERVEIVEGPVSVQYGSNALGGAINLITRKSQLQRYDAQLVAQAEQLGHTSLSGALGIRPIKPLLLRLDAGRNTFAGFNATAPETEQAQRTFEWNPKEQWSVRGTARYDLGQGRDLRYTAALFDELVTNLGLVRRPQFRPYAFDDYYRTRRQDHTLSYEGPTQKNLYWTVVAGYNAFTRQKNTFRLDMDTGAEEAVAGAQDTTRYNAFMLRPVLASRYVNSKLNFQAGLDINYESGYGQRFAEPGAERARFSEIADYGAFATLQYAPVKALQVQVGARAAYNTRFGAPVVPSVHIKYDWHPNWQLRASYARGFRSPSIKELFFYFVDINHYIIGNPDLQAELSDNAQAALDYNRAWGEQRFGFGLTLFYNDIRDKIDLFDFVVVDGQMVPAASLGLATTEFAYFNQARFRALGSNGTLQYSYKGWELGAGVAPTARYNPLSETDASVAAYTWASELNGRIGWAHKASGWRAAFFIKHNDRLIRFYQTVDRDGNSVAAQAIQGGFTLADLTLSKSFWKGRIVLTGGAQNLLDVTNVALSGANGGAHSGDNASPVAMGRNYFARVAWQLQAAP